MDSHTFTTREHTDALNNNLKDDSEKPKPVESVALDILPGSDEESDEKAVVPATKPPPSFCSIATAIPPGMAGTRVFASLAYSSGQRLFSKDNVTGPVVLGSTTWISTMVFNISSLLDVFDKLRNAPEVLKASCSHPDPKEAHAARWSIVENFLTTTAGVVSGIPIIKIAYDRFTSGYGHEIGTVLAISTAILFGGVGNAYISKTVDNILWGYKTLKSKDFLAREEIIRYLGKFNNSFSKFTEEELKAISEESKKTDTDLETKIIFLAQALKAKGINLESLSAGSKESLWNCGSFVLGSLRSAIFFNHTKGAISDAIMESAFIRFLGMSSFTALPIILASIALVPSIAQQGDNFRHTINSIRSLTKCKDITCVDVTIGIIAMLASTPLAEVAFTAGLGGWTLPLTALTVLGSMASNSRGWKQCQARFFPKDPISENTSENNRIYIMEIQQSIAKLLKDLTEQALSGMIGLRDKCKEHQLKGIVVEMPHVVEREESRAAYAH